MSADLLRQVALNPALKWLQLEGLTAHCMNDKLRDPMDLSLAQVSALGVKLRTDDEGQPFWTAQDIIDLWK